MPDKVVKRVDATKQTLAFVYLYSGNQCAFPGCGSAMFQEGAYVGELCHIEAAMPGGERYNPNMTNEERRHESNLMLMCGIHHRLTDNVEEYPVERMRQLKRDHEEPFRRGFTNMLLQEIRDYSAADTLVPPTTTAALCESLGWGLDPDDMQGQVSYFREFGEILAGVTRHARMLLAIAIKHAHREQRGWGLTVSELSQRLHESEDRIGELALELSQSHIAFTNYEPDYYEHNSEMFEIGSRFEDQLTDLDKYARGVGVDLIEIIGHLRFDLLDSVDGATSAGGSSPDFGKTATGEAAR